MKKSRIPPILFSLIVISISTPGCSIFTPVGDAISQMYENTVSYFNIYYNARRVFNDAQDEIRAATLAARSKNGKENGIVVPVAARQKLNIVIDKCSAILSLHPKSSLVDNAILLIGKSYFYEGEYLKAERKFLELIEQYPSSSLAIESKLWHARTLDRLNRYDDAIAVSEALLVESEKEGEDEIAGEAHMLLGAIYDGRDEREKAVTHYLKVRDLANDDEVRADAQMRAADIYFDGHEMEKAIREYRAVRGLTDDIEVNFRAKLQIAVSMRDLGRYDEAEEVVDALLQDFRLKEKAGTVRLERANILDASGKREEALDEFRFLDTTYANSETGAKASYALGNIYENQFRDYILARRYFSKSADVRNTPVSVDAARKSTALGRYIDIRSKFALNDSLLQFFARDSSSAHRVDSLKNVRAGLMYDFAEVFQSELFEPDSAVHWYKESLAAWPDSGRSPRTLLVLAELCRSNPEANYGKAEEYYQEIVTKYPLSKYADQARAVLNLPVLKRQTDTAEKLFIDAENLIDSKQYDKAISALNAIANQHSVSPYAARSEYALGWLYENRLSNPDSAVVHYRRLVDRYSSSNYAILVKPRIQDSTAVPIDSLQKKSSTVPPDQSVKDANDKENKMGEKQKAATPPKREDR